MSWGRYALMVYGNRNVAKPNVVSQEVTDHGDGTYTVETVEEWDDE